MSLAMLDLCSGTGGASAAMVERGWDVCRVDIDPAHRPDFVADVLDLDDIGRGWDLVWCSPPCVEFTRTALPWLAGNAEEPCLDLVRKIEFLLSRSGPRFWVVENVRGAVQWFRPILGEPRAHFGGVYLWGSFPPFTAKHRAWKTRLSGRDRVRRAAIPYGVSRGLAVAIESVLPGF